MTGFDFRAHRVGPTVLGGMLVYPCERAREAMRAARELMDGAPEPLTVFAVLLTAPPEEPFPPELRGRPAAVIGVAWSGDLDEGERVLAPLRASCPPVLDLVAPMPYVALQSMLDETTPHGWHYYDRLHYLEEVSDALIDTLVHALEQAPTPQSHIITGWMGGAIDRVPPGATAFGHRGVPAETWLIGCSPEQPVGPVRGWVRRAPFPEPPKRLPEAVERLGVPGIVLKHRCESVARSRPIGLREVLPAALLTAHRGNSLPLVRW